MPRTARAFGRAQLSSFYPSTSAEDSEDVELSGECFAFAKNELLAGSFQPRMLCPLHRLVQGRLERGRESKGPEGNYEWVAQFKLLMTDLFPPFFSGRSPILNTLKEELATV